MKQHITIEQLEELTLEQRMKIGRWLFPPSQVLTHEIPLLSIGRMIEYLDEHKDTNDFVPLAIDKGEFEWHVYSVSDKPSFRSVELCDTLWGAVKETL